MRCWLEVDTETIKQNYNLAKKTVGENVKIIAVVKSDAYGLGAVRVAAALAEVRCDSFAVASFSEGQILRAAGVTGEILILGYTDPYLAPLICKYDLTQAVFSAEYAIKIQKILTRIAYSEETAINKSKINDLKPPQKATTDNTEIFKEKNINKLKIQIAIDSGMNRLGFRAAAPSTEIEIKKLAACPLFDITGIFSHLACSDDTREGGVSRTKAQGRCFSALLKRLEGGGITFPFAHIANSAGGIRFSELRLNAVRFGACLYGLNSVEQPAESHQPPIDASKQKNGKARQIMNPATLPDDGLQERKSKKNQGVELLEHKSEKFSEVYSLKCKVAQLKKVKRGEYIGYGSEYLAQRDMKTATVTIGYADGYFRSLSDKGSMIIGGKLAKVVGKVCMDMTMLDVTDTDIDIKTGDTVTVWGLPELPLSTLATLAGTIDYELLCRLSPRVRRVYK